MNLNNVFDKIFVINMDKDKEKWRQVSKEFKGIKFEKISGVNLHQIDDPVKRSIIGNRLSHLKAIVVADKLNCKNVLVLEDDAIFDKNVSVDGLYYHLKNFMNKNDWATFYLGGHHRSKLVLTRINDHVVRTKGTVATHAIAYNSKYYKSIIQLLRESSEPPLPIDYYFIGEHGSDKETFVTQNPCYCVYPRFILQSPGTNVHGHPHNLDYWKENY